MMIDLVSKHVCKHSHTSRSSCMLIYVIRLTFSRLIASVDCQVLVGLVIAMGIVCIHIVAFMHVLSFVILRLVA